ncbi:hypothetical protein RKD19_002679 [Streptomyces canus]
MPPEISGGQGLKGLRERVGRVGGMVHTGPTEDGGFRIAGMLPYGEESKAGSGAEGWAGNGARGGAGPYGATSVAPARDFRGQRRPGAVGDGGTVINGADPQREFTTTMSTRKNVAIGCGVTAVVLVAGVIALGVWGVGAMTEEMKKADISPTVYEEAKVGDAEADIQARLPEEDSWLTSAPGGPGAQAARGSDVPALHLQGRPGPRRRHRLPVLLPGREVGLQGDVQGEVMPAAVRRVGRNRA